MGVVWQRWTEPPFPASHLPPQTKRYQVSGYTVDWEGSAPSKSDVENRIQSATGRPAPVWDRRYLWIAGVGGRFGGESTPIVFNGRLLIVCFTRDFFLPKNYGVEIRDYLTDEIVSAFPWEADFGCAIVVAGEVNLFGTTAHSSANLLLHTKLDATLKPGATDTVFSVPGGICYNSTVCASPNGFEMIVEHPVGGQVFLRAPSIAGPWSRSGGSFNDSPSFYAACPKIVFKDGYYYNFYLETLANPTQFRTRVARSTTLAAGSWQVSPKIVLSAEAGEGVNASDFDYCPFNGRVYGFYFDGDQATWGNSKKCEYFGTEEQFLAEFF